jgi:hypothetical protein
MDYSNDPLRWKPSFLVRPNSICDISNSYLFLAHSNRNEILEQNPELAEELLSEIDRMKEEKERLEQERLKLQAEAVRLEQELASASQDTTSPPPRMWGDQTAYSQLQQQQQPASSAATDDSAASKDPAYDAPHNTSSTADLDDLCPPSSSSEASTADNKASADFSLKSFVQEVITEFEKDARRITSLVLPVVRPFFSAGNVAWRYLKILFHGAKEQLKKYHQASSNKSEPSKQAGEGSILQS